MKGLDGISAQVLSDTIGAIYDCALDPERWNNALRSIVQLCDSPSGGICVHHIKDVQNDRLFEFGYPPGFTKLYDQYVALSPFTAASALAEIGDVITGATAVSDEELFDSRFYRELLKPFGYLDMIGMVGLKTSGRIASLHATRTDREPRYGERETALFKLLSPHICRTLAISDALDIRTLRSEMLEKTLDGLVAGVFLTSRDGRVVYMNAAAERQVKTGNSLSIVNNRVFPTDPVARVALSKAIDDMVRDEANPDSNEHSLAVPGADGAGYVATLLPVQRGRRLSIMAPFAASVAIFTQDPVQTPLMPGKGFAKLYGLTGGELRVLMALAQGLGAKEAADMLGISEPTARTHLQRIFSKTGTSRQADLLRLLQNSSPPIHVPDRPAIHS